MTRYPRRLLRATLAAAVLAVAMPAIQPSAQGRQAAQNQKVDEAYTALIRQHTQDTRITTELVDHLPASDTVPSPLEFHGRIVGTPDELTYARDIHRYFEALDTASDRVSTWSIGQSEEGRDMYVLAVADAATIKQLEKYKGMLHQLSDPRKTTQEQAQALFRTAKPIYWLTSGIHSTENGGPEMLMELAYRLAVQETPFVQQIRDNVITFITPVIDVDGREKQVDTYYFNQKRPQGEARLPLMYWGKYVAHDNNRDGMGQILALTKNVTKTFLEWRPTVLHDLHEQSTYLYASTGTGPYNEAVDAITVDEWWLIAKTEVMEMTKRGVPGVWTYGFYDGWTPNYMFFIANARNSIGRFYEVMGYGPQNRTVTAGATTTSREWFRPNPPLPTIQWGPRNNTNIQQSGVLIALNHVAKNREMYLENYWIKNRNAVERGKNGPIRGWVIPADQKRKSDAAVAVNDLRRQGLEIHRANNAFKAGSVEVKAGDYIVRGDQPYRTIADMYFSVQSFAPSNPRPYDDTGWTFQYMRNLTIREVTDESLLSQPATLIAADVTAPGGIEGTGPVVIIDHTTDNNLVTFRFRHKDVRMQAAQQDFEAGGRQFRAGSFIIPDASASVLDPTLKELGISGFALASAPSVPMHELDVPRIGYVHSWQRTQDEGWVRLALDQYGVPYDYFGDIRLREGNLRQKYDVIVYPHVGGTAESQVAGLAMTGTLPLPYKKTAETPNLGAQDEADDIRGGMGWEGLMELVKFVREGGTLITEGATATIFPEYKITAGVNVESPSGLFARGSVMRGIVADRRSPIAYGYDAQVPVYFSQAPVMSVGAGAGVFGGGGRGAGLEGVGQNITPMAAAGQVPISAWDPDAVGAVTTPGAAPAPAAQGGRGGRGGGGGRGGFGGGPGGGATTGPRVIVQFPSDPADMLLSGTLAGGEALANRAQVIDAPLGDGHVVMFAIRPFWRWQTQGTFFMGFNAILHWNDLKAGRPGAGQRTTDQ
jgi:hypothetical protein